MKLKTTKKQIKEQSYFEKPYHTNKLYALGYCELQRLFCYLSPFAYSAGVYGWSCDYYQINNEVGSSIIFSTGYSPIGKQLDYDLVKSYEKKAQLIHGRDEMMKLVKQFVNEVTKYNKGV